MNCKEHDEAYDKSFNYEIGTTLEAKIKGLEKRIGDIESRHTIISYTLAVIVIGLLVIGRVL